jgi:predicted secreted protein
VLIENLPDNINVVYDMMQFKNSILFEALTAFYYKADKTAAIFIKIIFSSSFPKSAKLLRRFHLKTFVSLALVFTMYSDLKKFQLLYFQDHPRITPAEFYQNRYHNDITFKLWPSFFILLSKPCLFKLLYCKGPAKENSYTVSLKSTMHLHGGILKACFYF